MKRTFLLAGILLTALQLTAQLNLTGRLTDALTKDPVGFATVYLDGTSIGDVSADDGAFSIKVPAGRETARMIVSHLNYRTIAVTLTPQAEFLELSLQPKAAVLTRIEVEDENLRADNLKEFHRRLIGNDAWGNAASILNDEVIRFDRDVRRVNVNVFNEAMADRLRSRSHRNPEWSEDGKRYSYDRPFNLKAITASAVKILLPDLGYTLHLDLQLFENNYSNGRMSYLGTNFYIPITEDTPRKLKRYVKNRRKAYYGSGMHFIRSMLRDSLRENGFQVVEVVREATLGKLAETKPIRLLDFIKRGDDGLYRISGLGDRKVAVLYYGNRNVSGRSPDLNSRPSVLQSRMQLLGPEAVVHFNGAQADTNLLFSGDIGTRGLAWSLPLDYWPEE